MQTSKPKGTQLSRPATRNEPDYIGKSFLANNYTINGKQSIYYFHRQFWKYRLTHYAITDEDMLKSQFHEHFVLEAHKAGLTIRNSALENAAWSVFVKKVSLDSTDREMPSWHRPETLSAQKDHRHISFQNGILNLDTLVLQDHTPEWFSPTCLPFSYDPDAEAPNWLNVLQDIFEGDEERIALLQEWFGYCLTADTHFHVFMLFEGESRAGKGTIKNVLTDMIGKNNISAVRLEMFGERFHLFQTYGKLLNVIDETDRCEHFAEGQFKNFVAGGEISFEPKGKDGFSGQATARILILANEKPPIFDRSDGMWNRMLLLSFRKSFAGKENRRLDTILKTELSGIFNWSLEGLRRLYKQDAFTTPALSQSEKELYKKESNPARWWITDNCQASPDPAKLHDDMTCKAVYERYTQFCNDGGMRKLGIIKFNKELKKVFPKLTQERMQVGGERMHFWAGIEPKLD